MRDRARTGRCSYVYDRGRDFAAGVWVIHPAFKPTSPAGSSPTMTACARARRATSPARAESIGRRKSHVARPQRIVATRKRVAQLAGHALAAQRLGGRHASRVKNGSRRPARD